MFSCEDVRAALSSYLDDEVPPGLRRELERHLTECRTCHVLYDTTRKTLQIVTNAGCFAVPQHVSDRLVKRIMTNLPSPPPRAPSRS